MELFNNVTKIVKDGLVQVVTPGSRISIGYHDVDSYQSLLNIMGKI